MKKNEQEDKIPSSIFWQFIQWNQCRESNWIKYTYEEYRCGKCSRINIINKNLAQKQQHGKSVEILSH